MPPQTLEAGRRQPFKLQRGGYIARACDTKEKRRLFLVGLPILFLVAIIVVTIAFSEVEKAKVSLGGGWLSSKAP
jgi:hypothetical protein